MERYDLALDEHPADTVVPEKVFCRSHSGCKLLFHAREAGSPATTTSTDMRKLALPVCMVLSPSSWGKGYDDDMTGYIGRHEILMSLVTARIGS